MCEQTRPKSACQGGRPAFLHFLTHHSHLPGQPALSTLAIAYPCFSRLLQWGVVFWWSSHLDLGENYTVATGFLKQRRLQPLRNSYEIPVAFFAHCLHFVHLRLQQNFALWCLNCSFYYIVNNKVNWKFKVIYASNNTWVVSCLANGWPPVPSL